MNVWREFWDNVFAIRKQENQAEMLGYTMDEVADMGILCAQLGLTLETIPSMARAYMMLQTPGMGDREWQIVTERFLNAVREANRN